MTPDLLRAAGEALFGEHWRRQFAANLGIDARLLRRWLAGSREIPQPIVGQIYDELAWRVHRAQQLMCSMEQEARDGA